MDESAISLKYEKKNENAETCSPRRPSKLLY